MKGKIGTSARVIKSNTSNKRNATFNQINRLRTLQETNWTQKRHKQILKLQKKIGIR